MIYFTLIKNYGSIHFNKNLLRFPNSPFLGDALEKKTSKVISLPSNHSYVSTGKSGHAVVDNYKGSLTLAGVTMSYPSTGNNQSKDTGS